MSISTTKYELYRWDPVLFVNNIIPTPIIYLIPNKELLEFAHKNDNALLIQIHSTNSIYDNINSY